MKIKSGDIYLIPSALHDEIAVEWLVIRPNVDDNNLLLIAPVTDFFLCGSWDIELPKNESDYAAEIAVAGRLGRDFEPAQRYVRCGATNWIHADLLESKHKTGSISETALLEVRKLLHNVVHGIAIKNVKEVDCDPDYEEHIKCLLSIIE